jgi:TPR repeat protein
MYIHSIKLIRSTTLVGNSKILYSNTNFKNYPRIFGFVARWLWQRKEIHNYYSLSSTFHNRNSCTSHWTLLSRKHLFSTCNESVQNSSSFLTGEECYNLALEYKQKHIELQKKIEEQNAIDQYEAMFQISSKNDANSSSIVKENERTTPKANKNSIRQANIAVVQTIAKQTREKRLCQSEKKQVSEEVDYLKDSNKYMQYAAIVHGYSKALVQIANEILEKESQKGNNENNYSTSLRQELFPFIKSNMDTVIDLETIVHKNSTYVDVTKSLYQEAVNRGDKSAAIYNLAHILWTESEEEAGSDQNEISTEKKIQSIQLFHKAAMELNDMDALYFLGAQYMSLLGTPTENDRDVAENILLSQVFNCVLNENDDLNSDQKLRQLGYQMIRKASELGHGGASYYLSLLHRNGDINLGIAPSIPKFQQYLNSACDGDFVDADALYLRAHCIFYNEDGYGQNSTKVEESYKEFIKAGEAGNANGYISAGSMLHHGYGQEIPRDQRKAFELYQIAAEMGSIEGWRNVAACYALGHGVPQCQQTAQYITKTMLSESDYDQS